MRTAIDLRTVDLPEEAPVTTASGRMAPALTTGSSEPSGQGTQPSTSSGMVPSKSHWSEAQTSTLASRRRSSPARLTSTGSSQPSCSP